MQKRNRAKSLDIGNRERYRFVSILAVMAISVGGMAQDLTEVGSLWQKAYGDFENIPANWYCQGNAATVAGDSDVVITGWRDTLVGETWRYNPFILKLDYSTGDAVLDKTLPNLVPSVGHVNGMDVVQTRDGGYVVLGDEFVFKSTRLWTAASRPAMYLTKLDESGTVLWSKKYARGDSAYYAGHMNYSILIPAGVIENDDGTFTIAGTYAHIVDNYATRQVDMMVTKVSAAGEEIWFKQIGGLLADSASVFVKSGDEYLLGGKTYSYNVNSDYGAGIIYAVDAAGTEISKKIVENVSRITHLCPTADGELLYTGPNGYGLLDDRRRSVFHRELSRPKGIWETFDGYLVANPDTAVLTDYDGYFETIYLYDAQPGPEFKQDLMVSGFGGDVDFVLMHPTGGIISGGNVQYEWESGEDVRSITCSLSDGVDVFRWAELKRGEAGEAGYLGGIRYYGGRLRVSADQGGVMSILDPQGRVRQRASLGNRGVYTLTGAAGYLLFQSSTGVRGGFPHTRKAIYR